MTVSYINGILWMNPERAGYIPDFLSEHNPGTASEQIDAAYQHGGGWRPFQGFKVLGEYPGPYSLQYPDDEPIEELARAFLLETKELLVFFRHSWVAIMPIGTHGKPVKSEAQISRVD